MSTSGQTTSGQVKLKRRGWNRATEVNGSAVGMGGGPEVVGAEVTAADAVLLGLGCTDSRTEVSVLVAWNQGHPLASDAVVVMVGDTGGSIHPWFTAREYPSSELESSWTAEFSRTM
jgi:hypothetical protein